MATHERSVATEEAVVCCACSQQCGIIVRLENGKIASISGDKDHPRSQGFICIKASRGAEFHYSPDRVNWPLKRAGKRGEGKWEQIGWDQALDEIAARVQQLKAGFGPESIALTFGTFHGADWGLGERFLNLLDSPNAVGQDKVCTGPAAVGEMLTYGFGPTVYTYPTPGVTKCIVLWGLRPSASKPLLWSQIVKARRAGARLIVVDPLRTVEARQADMWVQIRPGSDTALALGWLNVVIAERLYDPAFVAKQTIGFDSLAARARQFPPSRVAELTWVSEESIVESARAFAMNPPAILGAGNGLCQVGINSVQAARAIACLVAITGNLDRPGSHRLAGPPSKIISNGEATLVQQLSPAQRAKRLGADRYAVLGRGYQMMEQAMAEAWYGRRHIASWTASAHEPALWRAIATGEPYPVKALFVQHHNPLGASPNARQVADALKSENLELLVVHDLFTTPTGQLADYLLPASHWLEKPFFSAGYAYMGFAGDYAEANYAALPSEFERRSDYELWRDLGRRLGQEACWPEQIEELWDQWLRPAGLNFAELTRRRGPWTSARPPLAESAPGTALFGTPSGKIELKSQTLKECGVDPLPVHRDSAIFERFAGEYPMVLTTGGRMIEGFHQNAQQMSWFRKKFPDPIVQIHPQTAARLGIGDGEWVAIETPIGNVRQVVRITDRVHPRVIQADRWWYPERTGAEPVFFGFWETNINVCTENDLSDCDPIMGSWPLRAVPCRVTPIDHPSPAVAAAK